tara:strand:- start:23 stop:457 length:435 start_codon:yes stop_codon:yes gene_type:complete
MCEMLVHAARGSVFCALHRVQLTVFALLLLHLHIEISPLSVVLREMLVHAARARFCLLRTAPGTIHRVRAEISFLFAIPGETVICQHLGGKGTRLVVIIFGLAIIQSDIGTQHAFVHVVLACARSKSLPAVSGHVETLLYQQVG